MAKGTRDVKSSHDELACALPSKGPLGCDCGPEWILALEMFGEELHYRVRDVADLHDLSLRGNFVRVGSLSAEIERLIRLVFLVSSSLTSRPQATSFGVPPAGRCGP